MLVTQPVGVLNASEPYVYLKMVNFTTILKSTFISVFIGHKFRYDALASLLRFSQGWNQSVSRPCPHVELTVFPELTQAASGVSSLLL